MIIISCDEPPRGWLPSNRFLMMPAAQVRGVVIDAGCVCKRPWEQNGSNNTSQSARYAGLLKALSSAVGWTKCWKKNWPRVGPIWRKPLQRFHLSRFFWGSWTETVFTRFFLGLLNTWMNKLTIFDGKFKAKYFFNYLYIMNKPKIVEKGWS